MKFLLTILLAMSFNNPADTVVLQDATPLIRPAFRPLAQGMAFIPASTPTSGNVIDIIHHGKDYRRMLEQDFREARELIEIECMLFGSGEIGREMAALLAGKASEGVTVRYIHENLGNFFNGNSREPVMTGLFDSMPGMGIDKRDFAPLLRPYHSWFYPSRRNHRKINIIDGRVAYVGGMNMNTNSLNDWDDSHMRICGPAVPCLHSIFLRHWNALDFCKRKQVVFGLEVSDGATADGVIVQSIPDGPDEPSHTMLNALIWVLDNAERYVWMETPYLTIPAPLMKALKRAAARGVDVRLLMPADSDESITDPVNHHYALKCAKAGIRVFLRENEFNHSKIFIADDYLSCIGSSNLDKLSLKGLHEVFSLIYDEPTALQLKAQFLDGLSRAPELDAADKDFMSLRERISLGFLLPFDYLL